MATLDHQPEKLRRCLGSLSMMGQAVATMGLTITATINIPQAFASGAGRSTWQSYAIAMGVILLVAETLVLFRSGQTEANGIAGFVRAGLGRMSTSIASWGLLLGYAAIFVACSAFFSSFSVVLLKEIGVTIPTTMAFVSVGVLSLELARRDVKLSANTMLVVEGISVLLVVGLCAFILQSGGSVQELISAGDDQGKWNSGLMLAVFSFIGFESAVNLGEEARDPARSVPFALRCSVISAGCMFLLWALVLVQGLAMLPVAASSGSEPLVALATSLGEAPAGSLIMLGATLSLFGSGLGSLTALGRVVYSLAGCGMLPVHLNRVHPTFKTPAIALVWSAVPLIVIGTGLVGSGRSAQSLYDGFGGFSVMAFLLVYGLVSASALIRQKDSVKRLHHCLVSGGCLAAIIGVFIRYTSGLSVTQPKLLASFAAAMAAGVILCWRAEHCKRGQNNGAA